MIILRFNDATPQCHVVLERLFAGWAHNPLREVCRGHHPWEQESRSLFLRHLPGQQGFSGAGSKGKPVLVFDVPRRRHSPQTYSKQSKHKSQDNNVSRPFVTSEIQHYCTATRVLTIASMAKAPLADPRSTLRSEELISA